MVSREPLHIDPEVDGLLREIADDPRSTLFKVRGPRNPMSWAAYTEPLSTWTPDLTATERHLLRAHRADVARLLRERWALEMIERPPEGIYLRPSNPGGGAPKSLTLDTWRREVDEELLVGQSDPVGLVAMLLQREPILGDRLSELVAAAMELEPSNTNRIYVAGDMIRRDELRSARTMYGRVLATDSSGALSPYGWMGIAHVESLRGNSRQARDWYDRAGEVDGGSIISLGSSLLLSAQIGDQDGVRASAQRIEDLEPFWEPAWADFVAGQLRTRAAGAWTVTRKAKETAQKLGDRLADRSRRILDVLL